MKSSTLENTGLGLAEALTSFVHTTSYRDIASEVVRLARGFILDGLGVIVAGSTEKGSRIVQEYVRRMGGVAEATIVGARCAAPAAKAALGHRVSDHAMDHDRSEEHTSE